MYWFTIHMFQSWRQAVCSCSITNNASSVTNIVVDGVLANGVKYGVKDITIGFTQFCTWKGGLLTTSIVCNLYVLLMHSQNNTMKT